MTSALPSEVTVELDAAELDRDRRRIGSLRQVGAGPRAIIAFAYEPDWLAGRDAFVLDPSHGLFAGDQYPRDGAIAGVFTDTAPDRWGRTLLERREAIRAREEGRRPRTLGEWEFVLGVSDTLRMGALRFVTAEGRHLDDEVDGPDAVPPMARLCELEQAASEVENPSRGARSGEMERLALLLAPGSSLGGARPKTTFAGETGDLWLAKFPSHGDRHDVGAWEFVLNGLAERAGIVVPERRLLRLVGGHRTFAARRFDRAGEARRLYASAMTLTGRRDRDDASYLDIALAIADHGAPGRIEEDLGQLFRRVVFNVVTAHRDDHLRNHGFLRTRAGWRLSPAFDVNPVPARPEHELSIDGSIRRPSLDLVAETAPYYRLSSAEAQAVIDEVRDAVAGCREAARAVDLPSTEIDLIAGAFAV